MTSTTSPQLAPTTREKRFIPITLREAEEKDIPQILALAGKFSQPDPETGERLIWTPPSAELLKKIIAAKECIVALEKNNTREDSGSNHVILGYNLRRSQTADESVSAMVALQHTLQNETELDGKTFAPMLSFVKPENVDQETAKIKNPFHGFKISISNQTVIDTHAQGSNVVDELTLAFSKNCVERFDQTFLLAAILSSNVRSIKMTEKVGAKLICVSEDGKIKTYISPNLVELIKFAEKMKK